MIFWKEDTNILNNEILGAPSIEEEIEKRVSLSEEFESDNEENLEEIDENQNNSVNSKIQSKIFQTIHFRNPTTIDKNSNNLFNRRSSSSSSHSRNHHNNGSVATGQPGRFLRGIEQSEIPKIRGGSEITSTIQAAIKQIGGGLENNNVLKRVNRRENSAEIDVDHDQYLTFNKSQGQNQLFKIVNRNEREVHTPKIKDFKFTKKNKNNNKKFKKHRSEVSKLGYNPYQQRNNNVNILILIVEIFSFSVHLVRE